MELDGIDGILPMTTRAERVHTVPQVHRGCPLTHVGPIESLPLDLNYLFESSCSMLDINGEPAQTRFCVGIVAFSGGDIGRQRLLTDLELKCNKNSPATSRATVGVSTYIPEPIMCPIPRSVMSNVVRHLEKCIELRAPCGPAVFLGKQVPRYTVARGYFTIRDHARQPGLKPQWIIIILMSGDIN